MFKVHFKSRSYLAYTYVLTLCNLKIRQKNLNIVKNPFQFPLFNVCLVFIDSIIE